MGTPCHFALFDLKPDFELDLAQLADRYRELARRFIRIASPMLAKASSAGAGAFGQSERGLSDPEEPEPARALSAGVGGHDVPLEATVQDPAFLMQQMHWREELEELHEQADLDGVAAFKSRLKQAQQGLNDDFGQIWQDPARRVDAERLVRRMQFLDKLTQEVRQLEERLDD